MRNLWARGGKTFRLHARETHMSRAELKKSIPGEGGSFQDKIEGEAVTVHYVPNHQWGRVADASGDSLNVGYAYIFAFVQNFPKVPIYKKSDE